jgi:hypothetical protein
MKAILIACFLVAILAVNPLEKYEALARQDDCVANVFDLIKPEIDAKLGELKTVPFAPIQNKDLSLQVEVLALLEKGKTMLDKCNANKPQPVFGDVVEWDGIAFLLASNCFKDVGVVLLLADTVVQNPTDYTNDVIVAIFGYLLGRQGVADCSQFEHFII